MAPRPLPNELWIDIIHHLPQSDILNISSTSKSLHNLAVPFLYSEFDATTNNKGATRATELFLRSLLERPELGTHVKKATFCAKGDEEVDDFMTVRSQSFDAKTWSCLREKMSHASRDKEFGVSWESRFNAKHNDDAFLALILHMVSKNLESLTFVKDGKCSRPYKFMHTVLMEAARLQYSGEERYPLSQLREVRFLTESPSTYGGVSSLRVDDVRPYLKLKSVKRLTCHDVSEPGSGNVSDEQDKFTATTVELHHCRMTRPSLKSFLSKFQDLKALHWKTGTEANHFAHCFDDIRDIPQLKATLEELVVDDSCSLRSIGLPNFTDMSGFGFMKSLEAGSYSLLGSLVMVVRPGNFSIYPQHRLNAFIAALPTSLQILKITQCQRAILSHVPTILGLKDKSLHNLKQLTLAFPRSSWTPRADGDSVQLAKRVGVELMVLTKN
ncbi:uncharacterized protein PAC_08978 [Phialocephala subalpina]|uniref:F-box domain-containing protein n=1 Tax=Phialocephala subalpina TaxID=576137 RepID=A0A1L7X230_9HELO|nr:uncharacterized protein PAC_08978 [Phialocephala subalpina]